MKILHKKIGGFTLVEMMVTIGVIGILSAIVYANFGSARAGARDDIRKADLKSLQLAIELYKAQNGVYPDPGCVTAFWAGAGPHPSWGCTAEQYIVGLTPDYIAVLPKDPSQEYVDGRGYIYGTNVTRTEYKLIAHNSVEVKFPTSYLDEFARCPQDYDLSFCDAVPQSSSYAVYSAGAADW